MITTQTSCFDEPSSLDFATADVFGSVETSTAEQRMYSVPTIQDQSSKTITRMACTRFGLAHCVNAMELFIKETTGRDFKEVEGTDLWLSYLKLDVQAEREGATLQSSLEQGRSEGIITGYVRSNLISEIESNLDKARIIFTGSQVGDWAFVTSDHEYRVRTDGRVVGHAFCIVGYEKTRKVFTAVNSYGSSNGYFEIPYHLVDTLFTRYAIIDIMDEEFLTNYRRHLMEDIKIPDAAKALEELIWNGLNPRHPATREEVAAMIYRAIVALRNNS